MSQILSIREIMDKTHLGYNFLNTALGRPEFEKHIKKIRGNGRFYEITQDFKIGLIEFLHKKYLGRGSTDEDRELYFKLVMTRLKCLD